MARWLQLLDGQMVTAKTSEHFACWVKISADDILEYFPYFFTKKIGLGTSCKLSPKETICMKCQILFSRKNKKNIMRLSSAEFAHSMGSVNISVLGCLPSWVEPY